MDSFTTENRSTYEVDFDGSRVRRLINMDGVPPTPRQGQDGQWNRYAEIRPFPGPNGKVSIEFVWEFEGDIAHSTCTGPVIMATRRVQDVLNECRG